MLLSFVAILAGCIIIFTLPNASTRVEASTGSQLSASTQAALEQSMRSTSFVHEGRQHFISRYFRTLFGNGFGSSYTQRVVLPGGSWGRTDRRVHAEFNIPDPITSFIPVAVFQELTTPGVYTFMGEEWGVIIDVFLYNGFRNFAVQVVGISATNNVVSNEQYVVSISTMFEARFVWLSVTSGVFNSQYEFNFTRNGPMGLYAMPYMTTRQTGTGWTPWGGHYQIFESTSSFQPTRRNYIANFAFSGILSNEQNANPGHAGFVHAQEFGHFFAGHDLHFSAYDLTVTQDGPVRRGGTGDTDDTNFSVASAIRAKAGFIPVPYLVGVALHVWGLIDDARSLQPNSPNLPPVREFNRASAFQRFFAHTHTAQLDNFERLMKNTVIMPVNSNLALVTSLTQRPGTHSNARAIFSVAQQADWQDNRWVSRLNTGFTFDVRRHVTNNTVATAEWEHTEILYRNPKHHRPVTAGQVTNIYNYHRNTSRFRFVPEETGVHAFNFVGRASYRILSTQQGFLNTTRYLNRGDPLTAGVPYYFSLEYLHRDYFNEGPVFITTMTVAPLAPLDFFPIVGGLGVSLRQNAVHPSRLVIPSQAMFNGTLLPVVYIRNFWYFMGTEVVIPDTVRSIASGAFQRTAIWDNTPLGEVVYVDNWAVGFRGGSVNSQAPIQISIRQNTVGIADWTFRNRSDLTHVTFPEGLRFIGSYAFANCRLVNVTIPSSVETIGSNAFSNNHLTLERVYVNRTSENQITQLGSDAFGWYQFLPPFRIFVPNCSVFAYKGAANWNTYSFVIRDHAGTFIATPGLRFTRYGEGYLVSRGIDFRSRVIYIPAMHNERYVIGIADNGFQHSNVVEVIFEEGSRLETVGERAFVSSQLARINLPNTVTRIGASAFSAALESFTIPELVTRIEMLTFAGLRATSITIPNSVTYIGSRAFSNAINLTNIVIPASVTSIGVGAFENTPGLRTLTLLRPSMGNIFTGTAFGGFVFGGFNSSLRIYVPCGDSLYSYRAAPNWNNPATAARITITLVPQIIPPYILPTNLSAYQGQLLSSVSLSAGWSWVNLNALVGAVGSQTHLARFTPTNLEIYRIVYRQLSVVVKCHLPPPDEYGWVWVFDMELYTTYHLRYVGTSIKLKIELRRESGWTEYIWVYLNAGESQEVFLSCWCCLPYFYIEFDGSYLGVTVHNGSWMFSSYYATVYRWV